MVFLNAVRLLLENFKNTYKIMLYKFVVSLVAAALCAAMLLPELSALAESAPAQQFLAGVEDFFAALFTANTAGLTEAKELISTAMKAFVELLSQRATGVILATVGCVVVYLVKRFAETICYFTVGDVLDDKMNTYGQTPFLPSLVANLGRGSVYALIYVPITFLWDVLTMGLVLLIFSVSGVFTALFLSMTVIVVMQALKLVGTGLWLPAMSADKKTFREALHVGTKQERKQRVKMFGTYIEAVYAVVILNVAAGLCTFGSALIITVPASYFLFICLQYVYYYTVQGRKYFISFDRIASNPDKGDREHIFDYINETHLPQLAENATEDNEKTKEEVDGQK